MISTEVIEDAPNITLMSMVVIVGAPKIILMSMMLVIVGAPNQTWWWREVSLAALVEEPQALLQVATRIEVVTKWHPKSQDVGSDLILKGAAVGSLAGQLAERGVNHFIEDREIRSDLGSLADLAENPARELVKTAGVTVLDGALGALGGKMDAGADKVIMATANRKMTRAVAKGSTTAVKKAVKSGLKIAGKKATDALAEEAGNMGDTDKEAKNVTTAIKGIGQLSVQVARQPTEKVPTLKFLASQVPQRGTIPEELCINLNEIATALEEFGQLETDRQPTDPIIPLKCLGSQIPRGNISDDNIEDERGLTEQPQNLKFLASQIPQIPHEVIEDIGNEALSSAEENPEEVKCLGSQIPTRQRC